MNAAWKVTNYRENKNKKFLLDATCRYLTGDRRTVFVIFNCWKKKKHQKKKRESWLFIWTIEPWNRSWNQCSIVYKTINTLSVYLWKISSPKNSSLSLAIGNFRKKNSPAQSVNKPKKKLVNSLAFNMVQQLKKSKKKTQKKNSCGQR